MTETIFINPQTVLLVTIVFIRDLIWRGIALWKAGRQNNLIWFICLFLFNTMGVLPIVYIIFFSKNTQKTVLIKNKTTILKDKITNKKPETQKSSNSQITNKTINKTQEKKQTSKTTSKPANTQKRKTSKLTTFKKNK